MSTSPALRWFWRVYVPGAGLAVIWLIAQVLGPTVELAIAPIREDQRIENVVRTSVSTCWDWLSVKARPASAFNMDVFIETRTDRYISSVYDAATKNPWSRTHAVPVGRRRQSYCLLVPPSVRPDDAMTVKQVVYYPGFGRLWTLHVDLPDVLVPPLDAPP